MRPLADHTTDLLQGWGTVVGDLINVLAVLAAALLLWHQIKARNEENRDKEAGQARLVIPRLKVISGAPGEGVKVVQWEVHNYSSAPIPVIQVFVGRRDEHESNNTSLCPEDHLAPGRSLIGRLTLDPPMRWTKGQDDPPLNYIKTITEYMDAAGLIWHREDREPPRRKVWPPDPNWFQRWRANRWNQRMRRAHMKAQQQAALPPDAA